MLKKTLLAMALVALVPAAALAQGDDTGGDTGAGAGDTGGGDTGGGGGGDTGGAAAAAGGAMATTGAGPAIFSKGTMGFSFGVPAGGFTPAGTANLTYFADPNTAYDLILGVAFVHGDVTDPVTMMTSSQTTFGLTVGGGYRMYKHHSAKVHTYLEPEALIASSDLGSIGDNLTIGVGAFMGAEIMFTDWFSVRGQIGAELDFANKFKNISFTTGTSGLYASMYWK